MPPSNANDPQASVSASATPGKLNQRPVVHKRGVKSAQAKAAGTTHHGNATPPPPASRAAATAGRRQTKVDARGQSGPTNAADRMARLDTVLMNIVRSGQQQLVVRNTFRRVTLESTRGIGVCHLTRNEEGTWSILPNHATGRMPEAAAMRDDILTRCDEVYSGGAVATVPLAEPAGSVAVLSPVRGAAMGDVTGEVFLLVSRRSVDVAKALPVLERVTSAMQMHNRILAADDAQWQLQALASMTELVTKVESCDTVKQAAAEMANETVRHWKCASSAVAVMKKGRLKLSCISGSSQLDKGSETYRAYHQALKETLVRDGHGMYPPVDEENAHMLLAHKQLAALTHSESVYSHPLVDQDDNVLGAWLFTGEKQLIQSPALTRYMETASPKVASAMQLLQRSEIGPLRRLVKFFLKKTSFFTRLMIPIGIVAVCLLMALPVTYRVRCNGTVEPVSRRFAVAPFDGLVVSGFVEPGDFVRRDQVLAEIDGRSIRWELSGVVAERHQSLRQREIELAEGNIPETFLAELENERLTSQERILKFKRDHLEIRSPTDGVVLSGSLERSVAASVTTGETLFEIAPLHPMKVEVAIPDDEIAQVKLGSPVTIWIEGQEESPIKGKITRIHPRSETRDADNVFIAEVEHGNEEENLRPGMKGSVRIDCDKQPLAWCVFHKPVNYLRSRLTWW